jgi:hypothetical protein
MGLAPAAFYDREHERPRSYGDQRRWAPHGVAPRGGIAPRFTGAVACARAAWWASDIVRGY